MSGKDEYGYVAPCRLGVPVVGKDQHGYITLAFLGVPMVGIDQSGYITPAFSGVPMLGKDHQSGYITPAFLRIPNRGTKSEMIAQILPSMGPGKIPPKKNEHFEYKHMGRPILPTPSNGAPKLSVACGGANQFRQIGLYYGRDLLNILAP